MKLSLIKRGFQFYFLLGFITFKKFYVVLAFLRFSIGIGDIYIYDIVGALFPEFADEEDSVVNIFTYR